MLHFNNLKFVVYTSYRLYIQVQPAWPVSTADHQACILAWSGRGTALVYRRVYQREEAQREKGSYLGCQWIQRVPWLERPTAQRRGYVHIFVVFSGVFVCMCGGGDIGQYCWEGIPGFPLYFFWLKVPTAQKRGYIHTPYTGNLRGVQFSWFLRLIA